MTSTNTITIYHNPRCSKSREALAMAEQYAAAHGFALEVVDYLKTPLSLVQLSSLQEQLTVPVRDMVRNNETEYGELNLATADDTALLLAIASHPKLLQRPIVVYRGKAMIGRPPERLAALLQNA